MRRVECMLETRVEPKWISCEAPSSLVLIQQNNCASTMWNSRLFTQRNDMLRFVKACFGPLVPNMETSLSKVKKNDKCCVVLNHLLNVANFWHVCFSWIGWKVRDMHGRVFRGAFPVEKHKQNYDVTLVSPSWSTHCIGDSKHVFHFFVLCNSYSGWKRVGSLSKIVTYLWRKKLCHVVLMTSTFVFIYKWKCTFIPKEGQDKVQGIVSVGKCDTHYECNLTMYISRAITSRRNQ